MSSKEIETQLERQETWEDNLWEMLTQKPGKRMFQEKSNTAESQLWFFFCTLLWVPFLLNS